VVDEVEMDVPGNPAGIGIFLCDVDRGLLTLSSPYTIPSAGSGGTGREAPERSSTNWDKPLRTASFIAETADSPMSVMMGVEDGAFSKRGRARVRWLG